MCLEGIAGAGSPGKQIKAAYEAMEKVYQKKRREINEKIAALKRAAKGLYRPMLDCIMFSRGACPFCRVCEAAVARTIRYYSE